MVINNNYNLLWIILIIYLEIFLYCIFIIEISQRILIYILTIGSLKTDNNEHNNAYTTNVIIIIIIIVVIFFPIFEEKGKKETLAAIGCNKLRWTISCFYLKRKKERATGRRKYVKLSSAKKREPHQPASSFFFYGSFRLLRLYYFCDLYFIDGAPLSFQIVLRYTLVCRHHINSSNNNSTSKNRRRKKRKCEEP